MLRLAGIQKLATTPLDAPSKAGRPLKSSAACNARWLVRSTTVWPSPRSATPDAPAGRHNRHDSHLMKPNRIIEWPLDRHRAASGYAGELVGCSWSGWGCRFVSGGDAHGPFGQDRQAVWGATPM